MGTILFITYLVISSILVGIGVTRKTEGEQTAMFFVCLLWPVLLLFSPLYGIAFLTAKIIETIRNK